MCRQQCQVDEAVQTRVSEVSDASQAPQQHSGAATPSSEEVGDPTDPNSSQPAGMEKNYTDTIESLLSELWKERLVCIAANAVLQHHRAQHHLDETLLLQWTWHCTLQQSYLQLKLRVHPSMKVDKGMLHMNQATC